MKHRPPLENEIGEELLSARNKLKLECIENTQLVVVHVTTFGCRLVLPEERAKLPMVDVERGIS